MSTMAGKMKLSLEVTKFKSPLYLNQLCDDFLFNICRRNESKSSNIVSKLDVSIENIHVGTISILRRRPKKIEVMH